MSYISTKIYQYINEISLVHNIYFVTISTFLGKRFCEPRYARRPWLIWFYDTSKQGLGAFIIHAANVWLSPHMTGNPCTW